ncbi:carbohydrate porin [Luteolibacter sp. SL250]|uniref:carbohydrate porin n=1 Tax=Luteolibacter sp. SL250 TaxID=2995170 RepID=UPI00226F9E91|nr:carbohydrate porin [Luteolibacter sp. SL250]WAC17886.1 carbohydrate porin [Luteolibacter sp. SL250]
MLSKLSISLTALALAAPLSMAGDLPATAPQEKSPLMTWLEGDYMLGTWGGLRTDLKERGADFELFYFGSLPSNVDGGIKTGTVYQGALLGVVDLDLEKLVGLDGGRFFLSSVWLHGEEGFSDEHIGDMNKVNLVDFSNMLRLWEAWYSQELLDGKLMVKAGIMSVDRDFIAPEYYNSLSSINFLNQTFFYPTLAFNLYQIPDFPYGNHSLPSTPYGALGVFMKVEPTDGFYVQAAVYEGNPDDSYHGVDFSLDGSEGALIYAETGFRWNRESGLPGSLKLGGFYHTDEFSDVREGVSFIVDSSFGLNPPEPREHGGNYGGYLLAEQYLWLEEGRGDPAMQGAIGFFRVAAAPGDRNLTEFGIDGGIVLKGLIPGRDWDTIGLGLSYLKVSDDIGDGVRDVNRNYGTDFQIPDYEGLVELSYKAQLTAWWTLQPSVQWVLHPGGRTNFVDPPGDAIAFVLQTTLRF